ncbi:hypothetical protein SAICODRAFT_29747 [Saitoella complicata NRRL Y-17804]|uniref:Uncharacterized protein n=1 Tax=Saitoella complicata (strain BCRC 22490 / CBS 7301 / JCM 7358 / NBRC 10748 / NRRL Y-17804) TaxID=698492 RepID=A0A0E9NFT9_SAICN|nr:uncharacterized protein SAICODRAFT_29747 [Saitoella complicata NRRL Y-17804]ODQ54215.1 hypothetical protein SAICODRAFT_29747 [Saitoella complicata NRRL Y-17804]GAO48551.1 hypothetical protein G7K_2724-t1 [Saitoella complicata NRRL Y-17804]
MLALPSAAARTEPLVGQKRTLEGLPKSGINYDDTASAPVQPRVEGLVLPTSNTPDGASSTSADAKLAPVLASPAEHTAEAATIMQNLRTVKESVVNSHKLLTIYLALRDEFVASLNALKAARTAHDADRQILRNLQHSHAALQRDIAQIPTLRAQNQRLVSEKTQLQTAVNQLTAVIKNLPDMKQLADSIQGYQEACAAKDRQIMDMKKQLAEYQARERRNEHPTPPADPLQLGLVPMEGSAANGDGSVDFDLGTTTQSATQEGVQPVVITLDD